MTLLIKTISITKRLVSRILKRAPTHTLIPEEEVKIFDLLKSDIKIVFDVGARDEISYLQTHKDAYYHLFEPNQMFADQLLNKLLLIPNIKYSINKFGLSDKPLDEAVYFEKSQSFMINPTIGEDIDTGLRFSLKTLDWYTKKRKVKRVDFLKIDTEGFDYKVLIGGNKTLRAVKYLQFEYWDGVKKFDTLLSDNFDLYLIMEPRLLAAIKSIIWKSLTKYEKKIDFNRLLIPLDNNLISTIDNKFIPKGCGGNVLGVNKKNRLVNSFFSIKVD